MSINRDVLDGGVKRLRGRVREKRGARERDYREMALGRLESTAGVLQVRRGRLMEKLRQVRIRMGASPVRIDAGS